MKKIKYRNPAEFSWACRALGDIFTCHVCSVLHLPSFQELNSEDETDVPLTVGTSLIVCPSSLRHAQFIILVSIIVDSITLMEKSSNYLYRDNIYSSDNNNKVVF